MNIISKPVPNYSKGRGIYKPEGIVIHIGEGSQEIIYQTFLNEPKSSHYCTSKTGEIWQFVRDEDTAWAQGVVVKPTATFVTKTHVGVNPNAYLLSIEHEGFGTTDFTEAQYKATSQLVKELCIKWNISIDSEHIIRHNTINGAKTCPGIMSMEKLLKMAKSEPDDSELGETDKAIIRQKIKDLVDKL